MKTYAILFFVLIIFTNISLSLPVPCGNCVGKFEVCDLAYLRHQCTDNLKCVTLVSDGAGVCVPTIEKNENCDQVKDYDPCESPSFACDRNGTKRCEATGFANLNDDCVNDRYCRSGMTCQGGKCKQATEGVCLSDNNCKWYEYCYSSFTGGSCVARASSNQDCNGTTPCRYGHNCINAKCVPYFSVDEGGNCSSVYDCKPGFECYREVTTNPFKCVKPTYHLLIGPSPTVAWGIDCDPYIAAAYSGQICRCDYGLHIYRFVKEQGKTLRESCKVQHNNFVSCMESNGCSNLNFGADTCFRKNCYAQYKTRQVECAIDPGSVVFCAASNITIFVLMAVLFVLLL